MDNGLPITRAIGKAIGRPLVMLSLALTLSSPSCTLKEPTVNDQDFVPYIRSYALAHYDQGGWDYVV